MKQLKLLIALVLSMISISAFGQNPVVIQQPYLFQKYITVKDSIITINSGMDTVSSRRYVRNLFARAGTDVSKKADSARLYNTMLPLYLLKSDSTSIYATRYWVEHQPHTFTADQTINGNIILNSATGSTNLQSSTDGFFFQTTQRNGYSFSYFGTEILRMAATGHSADEPYFGLRVPARMASMVDLTGETGKYDLLARINSADPTGEGFIGAIPYSSFATSTDIVKKADTAKYQNIAYVDTLGNDVTAKLGRIDKPFKTVDAALIALPSTGKGLVSIGIGTFISPSIANLKNNVSFIGSGRPHANWTITMAAVGVQPTITSPTRLIGGTILLGTFKYTGFNNLRFEHFGVDVGSDWATAFNGGVGADGMLTAQLAGSSSSDGQHVLQTLNPPTKSIVQNDLIILGSSSTAAFHADLIENTINPTITNVISIYNTWGVVGKTINGHFENIKTYGHHNGGFVLKANDYAYCQNTSANNIYCTSVIGNDAAGIKLISEGNGTLAFINVSNFITEYTTNGISGNGGTGGTNTGISLTNGSLFKTNGIGVQFDDNLTTILNANNVTARSGTGSGWSVSASSGIDNISDSQSDSNVNGFVTATSGTGRINMTNNGAYSNSTFNYNFGGATYGANNYGIYTGTGATGTLLVDQLPTLTIGNSATTSKAPLTSQQTTPLTTGLNDITTLSSISGIAGSSNDLRVQMWLRRNTAAGTSYTTASVLDGLSVDGSFNTPSTTKTWWERNPSTGIQTWGNAASTYLSLSSTGIGTIGGNFSGLTASKPVFTDASKNLTNTGPGTSSQLLAADGSTITTIPTAALPEKFLRLTGSGTGAATTISIPHGLTGVTAASIANVQSINSAGAGIQYVTCDATNINIVYQTAPVSGTNNLSYNIIIKP